jgi:PAS domain S-box-containing protein
MELNTTTPAILPEDQIEASDLLGLLDSAASGIWLLRPASGELYWSKRLARMFGFDLTVDKDIPTIIELTHPDDRLRHQETVDASIRTGANYEIEVRMHDREGKLLWLHAHGFWLRDEAHDPHTMIGFIRDVTVSARTRIALRRSEARFRSFVEQAPAAAFIKNKDSQHLYGNRQAARLAGVDLDTFLGSTAFDLFTPDVAKRLDAVDQRVLRENRTVTWTGPLVTPGGEPRQVYDVKFPVEDTETGERMVGGFGLDVTELHELRRRLENAERLESVGLLASGVAHDFNNLLLAISGNAELAMAGATAEAREHIQAILTATGHASALCRQLLTVGGKANAEPQPVNVCAVLNDSRELFELTIQSHCRLELRMQHDIGLIRADPTMLRQILVNLILNAKQASPSGSVIEVGCQQVEVASLPADDPHLYSWLPEDATDAICVHVEDRGEGIDLKDLGRVFEPYFAGRQNGHGLGLAAVSGIVKANHGALRVQSERGKGSRFECYFPVIDGESASPVADRSEPAASHGMTTAMVIDDDPAIVRVTVAMLKRLGIAAEAHDSGAAALAQLRERCAEFDLVISDITMPEIGGVELLRQLRRLDAELPVVLASGYRDDTVLIDDDAATWFLQKPWSFADLERLLAEIGSARA